MEKLSGGAGAERVFNINAMRALAHAAPTMESLLAVGSLPSEVRQL